MYFLSRLTLQNRIVGRDGNGPIRHPDHQVWSPALCAFTNDFRMFEGIRFTAKNVVDATSKQWAVCEVFDDADLPLGIALDPDIVRLPRGDRLADRLALLSLAERSLMTTRLGQTDLSVSVQNGDTVDDVVDRICQGAFGLTGFRARLLTHRR